MPKFKVEFTYARKEVFEVEAESEREAFDVAVCSTPDEILDCDLVDSDIYEVR